MVAPEIVHLVSSTVSNFEGSEWDKRKKKNVEVYGDIQKRYDAFVTAYLSAAWAEGIDITRDAGLRQVAERAGLEWNQLQRHASDGASHALLEENLSTMLDLGLWGVPSFRVSGGNTPGAFACWGQDRLWRIEDEIARRAA